MSTRATYEDRDAGIALMTVALVSTIVMLLGVLVIGLANHNTEATAGDRSRLQAVHGAEAGINRLVALIQKSRTEDLPCARSGTSNGSPQSHYDTTVQYYTSYPPTAGTELACPMSSGNKPRAALIQSVGRATGMAETKRTLQAQFRITPIIGAFNSAVFSDSQGGKLDSGNSFTVGKNSTFDGDVYTNGDWSCTNSVTIEGSAFVQGSVFMGNSCTVTGDLWANGSITMESASLVRRDVASSTDNIVVTKANNKPAIEGHASAGKLCIDCATTSPKRVAGVITENNPIGPPPKKDFPKVTFKRTEWQAEGWEVVDYLDDLSGSACAKAVAYIEGSFASAVQKQVLRIRARCNLNFSNNAEINLPEDLAIVTDGSITISQKTTFQSSNGDRREFFMVVPYYYDPDTEEEANKQECTPDPQGDVFIGNLSEFHKISISVYTPCKATLKNKNTGNSGQIYGGEVDIGNQVSLEYDPILIPGTGDVTGYEVDPAFTREIIG